MKAEQLDRINELAHKSKTPEGLTPEEKEEQAQLRKEYLAAFRANMEAQLQGVYLVDENGNRIQPKKKPRS